VPIKRYISFKTEQLIGTIVPQMNEKEPIFKAGKAKEKNKRSFTRKKNASIWKLKFLTPA